MGRGARESQTAAIPADRFLERAMTALTFADVAALHQLEADGLITMKALSIS